MKMFNNAKKAFFIMVVVGHALLVTAAGCHLCCEIMHHPGEERQAETLFASSQGQHAGLQSKAGVSMKPWLLAAALIHFLGYALLAVESFGKLWMKPRTPAAVLANVAVPTDDYDEELALAQMFDDGCPNY